MSLLRIRASEVLAAIIQKACPEIEVCAGPSEDGHKRKFPSIAIKPIKWDFSPDQEDEWKEIGDNRIILNVGRYDAMYQIQVGAKNPYVRAEIEQFVLDLFFQREGSPGIIVVDIADCHDAIVAYELGSQMWLDEAGFSDKWFSTININVAMPVLVERGNVFTMNEIRICLRADTAAEFSEISTATQECVAVDEDGCVTLSTPPA
jgi:hypothetical protein